VKYKRNVLLSILCLVVSFSSRGCYNVSKGRINIIYGLKSVRWRSLLFPPNVIPLKKLQNFNDLCLDEISTRDFRNILLGGTIITPRSSA